MNTTVHNLLSPSARLVLGYVTDAMQNAEEMGGVEDTDDYLNLMASIKFECDRRIDAAKTNFGISKNPVVVDGKCYRLNDGVLQYTTQQTPGKWDDFAWETSTPHERGVAAQILSLLATQARLGL